MELEKMEKNVYLDVQPPYIHGHHSKPTDSHSSPVHQNIHSTRQPYHLVAWHTQHLGQEVCPIRRRR